MSKLPPVMNEDFISEFNKNKPSQEFFDVCKLAEELIDIHNVGKKVGKCKYYDTCPSCSGWCNNRQPSVECVEFLINAYEGLKERIMGK